MLSIVTFKYLRPGYRTTFTSQHVNNLRVMVRKHYPQPHRFVCVTDDPTGLDAGIDAVPFNPQWMELCNPTWPAGPNCYPRLRLFDRAYALENIGERFVSLDLDAVIVRDMTPLWDRPEPFVIFKIRERYNGSMFLMTAGARQQVFDRFDPERSPKATNDARLRGSDQAWIEYVLGPDEATWTKVDGVFGWRHDIAPERRVRYSPYRPRMAAGHLPESARIVFFYGSEKPWEVRTVRESPWIRQHYP